MSNDVPDEVRKVARKLDRGQYTHEIDEFENVSGLTAEEVGDWVKLAACGTPTYLHLPSGYGIVKGADGHTAIIKPSQLTPAAIATKLVTTAEAIESGYVKTGGMVSDRQVRQWVEEYHDSGTH